MLKVWGGQWEPHDPGSHLASRSPHWRGGHAWGWAQTTSSEPGQDEAGGRLGVEERFPEALSLPCGRSFCVMLQLLRQGLCQTPARPFRSWES